MMIPKSLFSFTVPNETMGVETNPFDMVTETPLAHNTFAIVLQNKAPAKRQS